MHGVQIGYKMRRASESSLMSRCFASAMRESTISSDEREWGSSNSSSTADKIPPG